MFYYISGDFQQSRAFASLQPSLFTRHTINSPLEGSGFDSGSAAFYCKTEILGEKMYKNYAQATADF